MYRIGLSSCGKVIDEKLFASYASAGIEAIELSVRTIDYVLPPMAVLAEYSKRYGVELWTCHLPFGPGSEVDMSSPDAAVRKNTLERHKELIRRASDIGIDKFVCHPSTEPIADDERSDRIKYSMDTLDKLAEFAHECGGVVAVEDLPRSCLGRNSDEMLELLSANDKLRSCFDTNHLLSEDAPSYIRRLGDRIITAHISDYDAINERHWLPGEGILDWSAILSAFNDIGYKGVWMYEIDFACPETIIRERDLTCEDFYRNAHEIFLGEKLTVISTPKENLGMWS